MKTVIQRVKSANVKVGGETIGAIDKGLLILIDVEPDDTEAEVNWIGDKIANLRIFEDSEGKMNRSVFDIEGSVLIVSQFTPLADCRRGRRPAFTGAAEPEKANSLYLKLVSNFQDLGIPTETGQFGADMEVSLINDCPVTLLVDRKADQG